MGKREKLASTRKQIGTAFIACSSMKKQYPCQAKDMYQGALFKKSLRYTEYNYQHVYILSAKYGVLSLTTIIKPYDKTLNRMTKREKEEWYKKVKLQIEELPLPFIFFTGHLYNDPFDGEKPLQGLSIGYQLQWFDRKLKNKNKTLI